MRATREKSDTALRTIGEVAKELELPQHVLRFWESKFNHIKPLKRRGGHRYYRPEDIQSLKEIKSLLHEKGLTIKGAKMFIKERNSAEKSGNLTSISSASSESKEASSHLEHAKLQVVLEELLSIQNLLKQAK